MPIPVRCSCGQGFRVKDELAGKAIKCPKCGAAIRVGQPAAATAGSRPAASDASDRGGVADLLAEEGIQRRAGPVCPACFKELKPGAKLCTQCGYDLSSGGRVAGVVQKRQLESEFGHEALDNAAESMRSEAAIQKTLKTVGFPWWMLAFLLVFLVGAGAIGVLTVDRIFTTKPKEGDTEKVAAADPSSIRGRLDRIPVAQLWGLLLMAAFVPINLISHAQLSRIAFKESARTGWMALLLPGFNYVFGLLRWGKCRSLFMAQFISLLAAVGGLALVLSSR